MKQTNNNNKHLVVLCVLNKMKKRNFRKVKKGGKILQLIYNGGNEGIIQQKQVEIDDFIILQNLNTFFLSEGNIICKLCQQYYMQMVEECFRRLEDRHPACSGLRRVGSPPTVCPVSSGLQKAS